MKDLERRLAICEAERTRSKRDIMKYSKRLRGLDAEGVKLMKARELLVAFFSDIQHDFKEGVESLLTLAVRSVYGDRDYEFTLEFKERKDRVEAIPIIFDGHIELIPKEDAGGGMLPIIGFPMRVILLGGGRRMIWLDEPLKGALGRSDDMFFRAIRMFKEVSEEAGIQVIINSHETDLIELADTVHRVTHDGVKSEVKRIKPKMRKVVKRNVK